MTSIAELIQREKTAKNPEPPLSPVQQQIRDAIEAAKRAYQNPAYEPVEVVLGGELLTIEIAKVWGDDWQDLEAHHPPVTPEDRNVGYNRHTLPRDYPAERIEVAGEHFPQESWRELYDVLDASHQENVSALMWGINILEPMQELERQRGAVQRSHSPS